MSSQCKNISRFQRSIVLGLALGVTPACTFNGLKLLPIETQRLIRSSSYDNKINVSHIAAQLDSWAKSEFAFNHPTEKPPALTPHAEGTFIHALDQVLSVDLSEKIPVEVCKRLQPGDLVVGLQFEGFSLLLSQANRSYEYSGHVGIVGIEEDGPVVYEMLGHFNPAATANTFMEKIVGGVQRHPLQEFFKRYLDNRIIRLPDANRNQALAQEAKTAFTLQVFPFDPFFDPRTQDTLCCTEFPRFLMSRVGYPVILPLSERNEQPEISPLLHSLEIATPHFLTSEAYLNFPDAREVLCISRFASPQRRQAVLSASAYLHEKINRGFSMWHVIRMGSMVAPELTPRAFGFLICAEAVLSPYLGRSKAEDLKYFDFAFSLFFPPPDKSKV